MVRAARRSFATSAALGFRNIGSPWPSRGPASSLAAKAYRIGTLSRDAYTVHIEPHGRTLPVGADQPVLEAALAAGLNLPHSCKSGHCSSCRARLVSGAVHYPNGPPLGLSAAEAAAGEVLLCQARPASALTVQARLIASVGEVEIKTLPCRIARLEPLAP